MPINPIQTIGQIRAQYDFANLTVRLAGVDITGALREIGDAGGNTVEEAELQFPAGSRIALAMNCGRIVPKNITLSSWAEGVTLVHNVLRTASGGGNPMIVEVSLQFRFSLSPKDHGLAAVSAPIVTFDWERVRMIEDGLSIPAGAATSSMVFKPITPWITNGISL